MFFICKSDQVVLPIGQLGQFSLYNIPVNGVIAERIKSTAKLVKRQRGQFTTESVRNYYYDGL